MAATALEDFTGPEPQTWCEFFIDRGRTLASYGRGNRDVATMQGLGRLREEAERVGLRIFFTSAGDCPRGRFLTWHKTTLDFGPHLLSRKIHQMSPPGQSETFPASSRMSAPGGKADEIGTITDIGQRMSPAGG